MFRRPRQRTEPAPSVHRRPLDRPRARTRPRALLLALLLVAAPAALVTTWHPRSEPDPTALHHPFAGAPSPAAVAHRPLAPAPGRPAPTRRAVAVEAATERAGAEASAPATEPGSPAPPARLEIVVLASDGVSPVPGARIELVQADPATSAPLPRLVPTEGSGRIVVGVDPGALGVVAWSEEGVGGPLFVDVAAGWNGTVEVVLEPAHEVRGRIVDAVTGAPVPEATIGFWCVSNLDLVRSGPDGSFAHPRFPAAAVAQQVRVEAPGYGPTVRYLRVDRDGAWEFPSATDDGITLSRTSGTPWIEIELFPELRLSGRVVGAAGQPIADAVVAAEGYYHTLPGVASLDGEETRTNAAGEFLLGGLRTDVSHSVVINAPGYAEWYDEVEVAGAAVRALGEVRLESELLVAGVVVDGEGLPVEDIAVDLEPVAPTALDAEGDALTRGAAGELDVRVRVQGHLDRRRTCPNGTFLFEGLEEREYVLRVLRDDAPLLERRVFPGRMTESTNMLLELPLEALVLRGEVRDDFGPVAGARVELRRFGAVGTVRADAQGRFRIAGLDSRAAYRVTALRGQEGEVVQRVETAVWAFERPILRLGPPRQENLALLDH